MFTLQPIKNSKGTTFLQDLQRRRTSFSDKLGAKIQGSSSGGTIGFDETPEDLSWVIFQEFGTATKRQGDVPRGIPGPGPPYEIKPKNTDFLRFPDPENKFPATFKNAEGDVILSIVKEHPGIRPGNFIRPILDGSDSEIKVLVKDIIKSALLDNPNGAYDFEKVHQFLIEIIMPSIIDSIATSMGQVLTGTREDGRLGDRTAEEVFREAALVVEDNEF